MDFIWNPDSIDMAKKDPSFKQAMIDLAFNYLYEKHKIRLSPKWT